MGFEHAFFSQMRKKLASRYKFHEHVQMPGVLSKALKINLTKIGYTMKG